MINNMFAQFFSSASTSGISGAADRIAAPTVQVLRGVLQHLPPLDQKQVERFLAVSLVAHGGKSSTVKAFAAAMERGSEEAMASCAAELAPAVASIGAHVMLNGSHSVAVLKGLEKFLAEKPQVSLKVTNEERAIICALVLTAPQGGEASFFFLHGAFALLGAERARQLEPAYRRAGGELKEAIYQAKKRS